MKKEKFLTLLALFAGAAAFADIDVKIDAESSRPASKGMYGIFFEEINRAGAGGIEANMIANGSFEDSRSLFFSRKNFENIPEGERAEIEKTALAWEASPEGAMDMEVSREGGMNENNPAFLRINVKDLSLKPSFLSRGFEGILIGRNERINSDNLKPWLDSYFKREKNGGINLIKGDKYDLDFYARAPQPMELRITLETKDGELVAEGRLKLDSKTWKNYSLTFEAGATDPYCHLKISPLTKGIADFDNFTLYPQKTWKGTKLRADIMERIDALKPAFVRFPGGCYVEGNDMFTYTKWKDTIGDKTQRKNTYAHWGYSSDNLLGYHEYLEMCEKLGASALYVVNCGMSHFEDEPGRENTPMDELQPLVRNALDAIEYAIGDETTKWGGERAKNGHPKPFNLEYIEVGNENGGPLYAERYDVFYKAIKEKYPQIKIVACDWAGTKFNSELEIFDSHHYGTPESFLGMVHRYDDADRSGYRVYFGEYAVTDGQGNGNMKAAVSEAAFMTGLERNSDLVTMTSFAPLLRRFGWDAWRQSAILFDGSRVCPTPSYFVQRMFGQNPIVKSFKSEVLGTAENLGFEGPVGFGTWDTQIEVKDVKVSIDGKEMLPKDAMENLKAWHGQRGKWRAENGSLFQDSDAKTSAILIGDKTWKDYTIEAKLRKVSGNEGFLIYFAGERYSWNLGGWSNTGSAVQGRPDMEMRPIKIDADKFYDVKIETKDGRAKLYLDGKLIEDVEALTVPYVSVSAGEAENGDVVIKVTNFYNKPTDVNFEVNGLKGKLKGFAETMYSEDPLGENSLEEPEKISPKKSPIELDLPKFKMTLKPNSVTIIRGKLK